MATKTDNEKWLQVSELKHGDIIKLTSGEECEFVRLKRKKFIGLIKGDSYDIPVEMFEELLEEKSKSPKKEIEKLEKGELFYIQGNNGSAILFEFDGLKGNEIIGINPIGKIRTEIDVEMYCGKVNDLSQD